MTSNPDAVKGFELLQSVTAQALEDDAYRKRLIADPKTVLRDAGLVLSDQVEVVIHQNEPNVMHLVLPAAPQRARELNPDERDVETLIRAWPF